MFTGASTASRMGVAVKPTSNPKDMTEATAITYYQMRQLLNRLKRTGSNDYATAAHNSYLVRYIENILEGVN